MSQPSTVPAATVDLEEDDVALQRSMEIALK